LRVQNALETWREPPLQTISRLDEQHMKRFRGGLVIKAHRLLCHSTLGLRVIKEKKKNSISAYLRTTFSSPHASGIGGEEMRGQGRRGEVG